MTTFIFLRHAISQANEEGILAGRLPGINLSQKGNRQANEISKYLQALKIDRVISSPLERCLQTIDPFLSNAHLKVHKDEAFIEMDYGNWSGQKLSSLSKNKDWKVVQKKPSTFKFPKGESFAAAQRRVEKGMASLAKSHPKKTLLVVSHGDIIKMVAAKTLNLSLDDFQRIVIDPASISILSWKDKQRTVITLNQRIIKPERGKKRQKPGDYQHRKVLGGGKGE